MINHHLSFYLSNKKTPNNICLSTEILIVSVFFINLLINFNFQEFLFKKNAQSVVWMIKFIVASFCRLKRTLYIFYYMVLCWVEYQCWFHVFFYQHYEAFVARVSAAVGCQLNTTQFIEIAYKMPLNNIQKEEEKCCWMIKRWCYI